MRVKADREKEEAASTKKAVAAIDKAAAAQYERDRAAAEASRKALGSWVRESERRKGAFHRGEGLESDEKGRFWSFSLLFTRFPTLLLRSSGEFGSRL